MFDMTTLITRYFDVKLPNGLELNVQPPRMKVLKKILKLSKDIQKIEAVDGEIGGASLEALTEALSISLSVNKQKRKITVDDINDMMDLVQMMELFTAYFNWVGEINNSKN